MTFPDKTDGLVMYLMKRSDSGKMVGQPLVGFAYPDDNKPLQVTVFTSLMGSGMVTLLDDIPHQRV